MISIFFVLFPSPCRLFPSPDPSLYPDPSPFPSLFHEEQDWESDLASSSLYCGSYSYPVLPCANKEKEENRRR